jgi:hypothetical protein
MLERSSRLGTVDELPASDNPHRAAWTQTPNLLFTGQERIIHRVLVRALLAAPVGWVVQPVRPCRAE